MANNIEVDKEKVKDLCKIVHDAWKNKEKIFAREITKIKMFPENQLISLMSNRSAVDKALWIFFSVLGDKKTSSQLLYKQFAEFYKVNPDFFNRGTLQNLDEASFQDRVETLVGLSWSPLRIQVNYPESYVNFVVYNVKKLVKEFHCDILRAIPNDDFDDCFKRLKKFKGYGVGLSALYLIFLNRYGVKNVKGYGVPKIDRHFVKMSAGCGIFDIGEDMRYDYAAKHLTKIFYEVCNEQGFNAGDLDPAVWVIGSELCKKDNISYCKELCPLYDRCTRDLPAITNDDTILKSRKARKNRNQFILPFYLE